MRDDCEKDFSYASAWKQLVRRKPYNSPEQVVGILARQKRVRELLYELNQKELPKVRREILKLLENHERCLKDLGGERNPHATAIARVNLFGLVRPAHSSVGTRIH